MRWSAYGTVRYVVVLCSCRYDTAHFVSKDCEVTIVVWCLPSVDSDLTTLKTKAAAGAAAVVVVLT